MYTTTPPRVPTKRVSRPIWFWVVSACIGIAIAFSVMGLVGQLLTLGNTTQQVEIQDNIRLFFARLGWCITTFIFLQIWDVCNRIYHKLSSLTAE